MRQLGWSLELVDESHITPLLRQLQWLPVRQRIDFKVMVLVYKSLHRLALPYLSDDCQLVASRT